MSLASTLLEGYNATSASEVTVADPSSFLMEACMDFVTESYNAFQIFKTADIIGQAQVLTESANPEAVYESVVKDFGKKLKGIISKFISKFTAWIKTVRGLAKKKVQAAKDNSLWKKINSALEGHDDDEKINGFSYVAIAYTIDAGLKATEAYVDSMNEVYYKAQEAMFSVTTGEAGDKQASVAKAYSLDKVKAELKKVLKCDPDTVTDKISGAFGAADPKDTTYTVGDIRGIMAAIPDMDTAAENQLKEAEALVDIVKELEQKFDGVQAEDGTTIDPEVLGVLSASISYVLNLEVASLRTSIERILAAVDQSRGILSAVVTTLKSGDWTQVPATEGCGGKNKCGTTEGCDPENDDDDDMDDDDLDGVTEGLLAKIKESVKKNVEERKEVARLNKELDLRGIGFYFTDGQKALRKKDYDGAVKCYKQYIKAVGEKKNLLKKLKGKYSDCLITIAGNSCDAEITLTKSFIAEAEGKKTSSVKEGVSIFEQASEYLL